MKSEFVIEKDVLIKYKGKNKKIEIPEGIKTIGKSVFLNNKKLEEIILPPSVEIIDDGAFYACENLKKINLENVKIINKYSFTRCYSLKEMNVTNLELCDSDNFRNMLSLEKITLSKINDSSNHILTKDVGTLKEIEIPGKISVCLPRLIRENVKKIVLNNEEFEFSAEDLFGIYNDIQIICNNSNYTIENDIIYSEDKTELIYCPPNLNIKEYIIPDTVVNINKYAFANNKNIEKIVFGKNIKNINDFAFFNSKIKYFIFNEKLEEIKKLAFEECSCETIDLHNTNIKYLNLVGVGFVQSENLKTIILPNNIEELEYFNLRIDKELICKKKKQTYPFKIQNDKNIQFSKTLDELIKEGKTFKEANNIINIQER